MNGIYRFIPQPLPRKGGYNQDWKYINSRRKDLFSLEGAMRVTNLPCWILLYSSGFQSCPRQSSSDC